MPIFTTNIVAVTIATAVDDNTHNNEYLEDRLVIACNVGEEET